MQPHKTWLKLTIFAQFFFFSFIHFISVCLSFYCLKVEITQTRTWSTAVACHLNGAIPLWVFNLIIGTVYRQLNAHTDLFSSSKREHQIGLRQIHDAFSSTRREFLLRKIMWHNCIRQFPTWYFLRFKSLRPTSFHLIIASNVRWIISVEIFVQPYNTVSLNHHNMYIYVTV